MRKKLKFFFFFKKKNYQIFLQECNFCKNALASARTPALASAFTRECRHPRTPAHSRLFG